VSHDNPWIASTPPPLRAERPAGRRVASLATTTGTLHARAFDRLASRFLLCFRARAACSYQGLWDALGEARRALVEEGALTEAQAQRVQEWLVRDLEHLAAVLVRGTRGVAAETRDAARAAPGALASLLDVLERSGDALYRAATHSRGPALRRGGEVTCAGSLACTQCGRPLRLAATSQLEPCRGCGGTTYSRGG
jgi:hypothetical protein